jgi:RNA polymerase sigma-70 factor (TIGR02954 family)
MLDNGEYVKAAIRGDHEAFYLLMQEHKVRLYRIAYSYLKNETDALEAIQEVTYRAYIKIKKLREPQFFGTWLTRIMINYCVDEVKKRKRMIPSEMDLEKHEGIPAEGTGTSLNKIGIETALEQMDPKYQTIIRLKYFHDETITSIAETLDKPVGTVKTWLNKALKQLRRQLEREGETHA